MKLDYSDLISIFLHCIWLKYITNFQILTSLDQKYSNIDHSQVMSYGYASVFKWVIKVKVMKVLKQLILLNGWTDIEQTWPKAF